MRNHKRHKDDTEKAATLLAETAPFWGDKIFADPADTYTPPKSCSTRLEGRPLLYPEPGRRRPRPHPGEVKAPCLENILDQYTSTKLRAGGEVPARILSAEHYRSVQLCWYYRTAPSSK